MDSDALSGHRRLIINHQYVNITLRPRNESGVLRALQKPRARRSLGSAAACTHPHGKSWLHPEHTRRPEVPQSATGSYDTAGCMGDELAARRERSSTAMTGRPCGQSLGSGGTLRAADEPSQLLVRLVKGSPDSQGI